MSVVNVHREQGDSFQDNPRYDDWSFTHAVREFRPHTPRRDWRVVAVIYAGSAGLAVIFFTIYAVWKTVYCWPIDHAARCAAISAIEPTVIGVLLFCGVACLLWAFIVKHRAAVVQQLAIANRINLTLDRFGDQVPADLFHQLTGAEIVDYLHARYMAATDLQRSIAPYQVYKGVNQLNEGSFHYQIDNALNADTGEAIITGGLTPIPPNEWIAWFNTRPHGMLAAATGEGKTITAKVLLIPRIQAGEDLCIIDPHASSWFGIVGRGSGENWSDVCQAIHDVFSLYGARMGERDAFLRETGNELPHDHFKRLNVLVDEAFLIREHLDTRSKNTINFWEILTAILGSGARKVGISVLLLTQTANVEDLGLSGSLRRNFARIALDIPTIKAMITQEEPDKDRRQQLHSALIGARFPAVAVVGSQVELLDRSGLDVLARTPVNAQANLWIPSSVSSEISTNGRMRPSQTNGRRTPQPVIDELRKLRAVGITRDQARTDYGLVFTNEDW